MRAINKLWFTPLAILLLTGCRTTHVVPEEIYIPCFREYSFDYEKPYTKISFDKLPAEAKTFILGCFPADDIKEVGTAILQHNGKPGFFVGLADESYIMFDKNGTFLRMYNWRNGVPKCLLQKIPHFDDMRRAINNDLKTGKHRYISCLEVHPNCYFIKVHVTDDILLYYFDKQGNLQETAVEI